MSQSEENCDDIRFTKNETVMAKSEDCKQGSHTARTNIVEDISNRNITHLQGTVPLPSTSWRIRTTPPTTRREAPLNEKREEEPPGTSVTPDGIISLHLHNNIRVDMTLDRAIRIMNYESNITVALSASGSTAALLHPNGRVYRYGSRVEIFAHDNNGNNKYAKMSYKGVSFTSDQCALVYLVDSIGTCCTTDSFSDLSHDFSLPVFYNESKHGPSHIQDAKGLLQHSDYWANNEGTNNWVINNTFISQTVDGLVRIGRNDGPYKLRTSPTNGSAGITTPFLHCTGSLGETGHLYVRRGERRMHYSGTTFIVRNAGHSAGFDDNLLKVY